MDMQPPGAILRPRPRRRPDGGRPPRRQEARRHAGQSPRTRSTRSSSEGGFYKALAEFIVDLPLFPFACIKGPVVRIVPSVKWVQGKAVTQNKPKMFWNRVSPFDLYWTPGVSDIEDAEIIERTRLTRADLNDLLDLPGYNADAIKAVLNEYGSGGLRDCDGHDRRRARGPREPREPALQPVGPDHLP
jgi:hypothetical protein